MTADVRLGVVTAHTLSGYHLIRDDMRTQSIHVGITLAGNVVHCATCDEPWPCTTAAEVVS